MKIKHLPNTLSILRIITSFLIFFTQGHETVFLILYIIAGISDILDGMIARYYHVESAVGARLDSIADGIFFMAVACYLFPQITKTIWLFYWIYTIAVIRSFTLFISYLRFSSFALLHTYLNKLCGIALFIGTPFFYKTSGFYILVILIALLSAFEELYLMYHMKKLQRDVKGILFHDK